MIISEASNSTSVSYNAYKSEYVKDKRFRFYFTNDLYMELTKNDNTLILYIEFDNELKDVSHSLTGNIIETYSRERSAVWKVDLSNYNAISVIDLLYFSYISLYSKLTIEIGINKISFKVRDGICIDFDGMYITIHGYKYSNTEVKNKFLVNCGCPLSDIKGLYNLLLKMGVHESQH